MFELIIILVLAGLLYLFRNRIKSLFWKNVSSVENKVNAIVDPAVDVAVKPQEPVVAPVDQAPKQ